MLALSIRQPYAEMILRGEKTIEYRSRPTKIIGQRFYIYAARKWAGVAVRHSRENGNPECPASMPRSLDSRLRGNDDAQAFPTGVIVGTASISKCERENGHYCWHLSNVKRLPRKQMRKPKRQPQPVWFNPF